MPFQPRNVSYCNKPLTEQRRPERLKDQGRGENTSGHQTILPLIGPVLECANTYKMVMKCELSASCASKKPFLCVFGGENNIYPTSDSASTICKTFFIIFTFLFSIHFKIKLMFVCLTDHLCSVNGSYSWTSYDYSKPLIHTPLFSHTSVVSLSLRKIPYDTMVG